MASPPVEKLPDLDFEDRALRRERTSLRMSVERVDCGEQPVEPRRGPIGLIRRRSNSSLISRSAVGSISIR
jgi:hypothetical protein